MRGWVVVALVVVGCSSSAEDEPSGPCAPRKGTYTMAFRTRGGDCGDLSEQVFNSNQPDDAAGKTFSSDPPCVGRVVNSADNCSATLDNRCPAGALSTKLAGKVDFTRDGAKGSGIFGITVYDPGGLPSCNGSYDVTFTRQ